MKDNPIIKKIRLQNSKLANTFGSITKISVIIVSGASIIINIINVYLKTLTNMNFVSKISNFLIIAYCFLLPIAIISGVGTILFKVVDIEAVASEYFKIEDKKKQYEKKYDLSQSEIAAIASQQNAILGGLSALEVIENHLDDFLDEKIALEKIINPLLLVRDVALGFKDGGLFNFAVYRFDKETEKLKPVFRKCDDRIVIHNREWGLGEGHIGLSFQRDDPLIHSDITDLTTVRAPKKMYFATDEEFYRSFLSAPIVGNAKKIKDRIGVLVITSSRSGQFGERHKILANCYTILINTYYNMVRFNPKENINGTAK